MALERLFSGIEKGLGERAAQSLEEGAQLFRDGQYENANNKMLEAGTFGSKIAELKKILGTTLSAFEEANIDQPPAEFLETLVGERETLPVQPFLVQSATLTELPAAQEPIQTIGDQERRDGTLEPITATPASPPAGEIIAPAPSQAEPVELIHTPVLSASPESGVLEPPKKDQDEEKNPEITRKLEAFYLNNPELELFTREHVREITGHGVFAGKVVKQLVDLATKRGVAEPKHRSPWLYPKGVFEEICYLLGPVGSKRGGRRSRPAQGVEQPPADESISPQQPDTSLLTGPESEETVPELDPAKVLLMTTILLNPAGIKVLEEVSAGPIAEEDLIRLQLLADRLSSEVKLSEDLEGLVLEISEFLTFYQQNPVAVLQRMQGKDEGFILGFLPVDKAEGTFLRMYEASQNRGSSTLQADIKPVDTTPSQEKLNIEPLTEYEIGVLAYFLVGNRSTYRNNVDFADAEHFGKYLAKVTPIRDAIITLTRNGKLKDTRDYGEVYDLLLEKLQAFGESPQDFLELNRADPRVNTLLQPLMNLTATELQYLADHLLDVPPNRTP